MAINEWEIWKKLGIIKPKKEDYVDIEKDASSILGFLKEVNSSAKQLNRLVSQFMSLRKAELKLKKKRAGKNTLKENIQKQIKRYDALLRAYEILELDTDVNGERIKKIANELARKAKELKADKELLKKVTKSEHWSFDW